jgi:hypothetical protein
MFWHGRALPLYARSCMQSFLDRGHRVRLFAYSPLDVPPGVMLADAGRILDASHLLRYSKIQFFADAFRYELLLKEGGWWIDVDVVCLTDKLPEAPYAWAEQEPGVINVAIVKFPAADRLVAQLATDVRALSGQLQWGATGPDLLSKVLPEYGPPRRAGSTPQFYPLHWLEAPLLLLPEYKSELMRRIEGSMFLHLWAHVFEEIGIDLDRNIPGGSLMYDLLRCETDRSANYWSQLKMRHALRKYWRQSWVRDHWSNVFGGDAKLPHVRYAIV